MEKVKKIRKFEKVIEENKSGFLQIIILYNMSCHGNYEEMTDKEKEKILGFLYNLYLKDETQTDLGKFSDLVMDNYKDFLQGKMTQNDIYILL